MRIVVNGNPPAGFIYNDDQLQYERDGTQLIFLQILCVLSLQDSQGLFIELETLFWVWNNLTREILPSHTGETHTISL